MSRKVLKKRFYEEKDEDAEEDVMCPPQFVPSSNLNEEWASDKAMTMEEGVPFEEKKEIKGANYTQNLVAKEGIGIEYPDTSGGQFVVSPSRRPDVTPGAEALGTRMHHPNEGRRRHVQEQLFPGAFREGGLDNEEEGEENEEDEEDERTIQSHTEPPIPPTVSAELVDAEEEERRRQHDIDQALQKALEKEHQLVQDQINQALQRERQQVIVAEVAPEVVSKRDRRWKFAVALLLLVLIVVGVVLGITLRPDTDTEPETVIPQDLIDFLSSASSDGGEALQNSSTPQYEALDWLAGDANLPNYTPLEKIQRYALATLYYSTKGDSWTRSDFWVTNADVCDKWYQFNDTTIKCTSAGAVSNLLLHDNNLVGAIPPEIGMLSDSLVELYLTLNELDGTLPNEIASLTKLTTLSLVTNILKGRLPSAIGLLTNLQALYLGDNELEGAIPSEIGRLTKLDSALHLGDNNLTGTIPTTLGSLVLLEQIFLQNNALEGPIPTELAQCQNLKIAVFESNTLTGDVGPIINMLSRSLTSLYLTYNLLSGTVPPSIGTFTDLDWLDLGGNNLNGTIPTELGLLSNLEVLALSSNQFTGTVPTSLASLPLLKRLFLFDNDLTGSVNAFCGIDFEMFAANTCAQVKIECACCTHCCDPGATYCEAL